MWLQELLSTDTHALGQRMSSNRISAADNEYTEGQVMLTGAKLCELIGPRSMAKRPSRQRPGFAPAPPRPGRLWAALRSQARRPAHMGAPSSASGARASRLRDADSTRVLALQARGWQVSCSRSTDAAPARPKRCSL